MIDQWDIEKLEKWLKLAKTVGTEAIKITYDEREPEWDVFKVKVKPEMLRKR